MKELRLLKHLTLLVNIEMLVIISLELFHKVLVVKNNNINHTIIQRQVLVDKRKLLLLQLQLVGALRRLILHSFLKSWLRSQVGL